MADITMCKGEMCAKKETCYRFTTKASEYQYYFTISPINMLTGECEEYWETENGNKRKDN